jgi:hypothetical protein
MKKFLFLLFLTVISVTVAQEKGTLKGLVTDKDANNEPLPFANIVLKGTTTGGTTDFDGNYSFQVPVGTHTVVFSFLGYKTVQKTFTIKAGEIITINQVMSGEEGVGLDEVIVKASKAKESEKALLNEQKNAVEIVESIGAERLGKVGINDALVATTKISGVNKAESSGDIFIRGLGDRYLLTTMNGLPIPSDDVDKKNINLNLFPTNLIQKLGLTKTFSASSYADQTSGHVDVLSKIYSSESKGIKVKVGATTNTNVIDKFSTYRGTQNLNNTTLGFYSSSLSPAEATSTQSWGTKDVSLPLNRNISITAGKRFEIGDKDLGVIFSYGNRVSFDYITGVRALYNANERQNEYNDAEQFTTTYNNTALLNFSLDLNTNNKIQFVNLFINKTQDNLFEGGRNGEGFQVDNDPVANRGSFIRDQNVKETTILIHQLLGEHDLSEKNLLKWAVGANFVSANEPNRIRNEVVIGDGTSATGFTPAGQVFPSQNNNFQNRVSSQEISDFEVNGYINDEIIFFETEDTFFKAKFGVDTRFRTRDFVSKFIGVANQNNLFTDSVDNIPSIYSADNFSNGTIRADAGNPEDTYNSYLLYSGGYVTTSYKTASFLLDAGLRFEYNDISLTEWDVNNFIDPVTFIPRLGSSQTTYTNILPHLNFKYTLNEKSSLRLVLTKTITLPEFKELAPFEYFSPTSRVIVGNPDLIASTNYNADLKYEFFPSAAQLISVTGFYKRISDPINFAIERGPAGFFTYDNTGDLATVYGVELESRIDIINTDSFGKLNFNLNTTLMEHSQDLDRIYQYNNISESRLVGAPNVIVNGGLNYSNEKDNSLNIALQANYTSDKIFALGAPRDQTDNGRLELFNSEIIENAVFTADLVISKQLSEKLSVKGTFRNLLNPTIKQTQEVRDLTTGVFSNKTVSEYKSGVDLGVSLTYSF